MARKDPKKTTEISFPNLPKGTYYYACGKRKSAIARVRLYKGTGNISINGKPAKEYVQIKYNYPKIIAPLNLSGVAKDFDVFVKVIGGGDTAQAEAIRHGISRALVEYNKDFRGSLKKAGYLTRDARVKERKKYGLKKARRAPQWQKR